MPSGLSINNRRIEFLPAPLSSASTNSYPWLSITCSMRRRTRSHSTPMLITTKKWAARPTSKSHFQSIGFEGCVVNGLIATIATNNEVWLQPRRQNHHFRTSTKTAAAKPRAVLYSRFATYCGYENDGLNFNVGRGKNRGTLAL